MLSEHNKRIFKHKKLFFSILSIVNRRMSKFNENQEKRLIFSINRSILITKI